MKETTSEGKTMNELEDERALRDIEDGIEHAIRCVLSKHADAGAHWQVSGLPAKMAKAAMSILRVTSEAVDEVKNNKL